MTSTMLNAPATGTTPRPGALAKGAALGIGLAVVANVMVYLVGDAGAPIQVVTGWEPDGAHLPVGDVIGATIALSGLGSMALWTFARFRHDGFREWAVVAALVALLSILPVLRLDIDAGSKVALSTMHVVVGATAIFGHVITGTARTSHDQATR